MKYLDGSEFLKALAHPVRMEIIDRIEKDGCNVSKIQRNLGLPQSTISQHLKVLKNAGILSSRREGTTVCYKVEISVARKVVRMIKKL